jgi:hypothetical protein
MLIDPDIQRRLARFQSDLQTLTDATMVQKHITYGDCYKLDQDSYYALKSQIADFFDVHTSEVLVVGSGKLGFSIVGSKLFRPFDDNESDIDIAIVSASLFDRIWTEVFDYWGAKQYWPEEQAFKQYLFRGWIRPDKLPPAWTFALCQEWWEFFRRLTSQGTYGPYKLRAGLYKSWYFLESYHRACMKSCRTNIEGVA